MFSVLFEVKPRLLADLFGQAPALHDDARRRQVRIVRDYGMYDRREAPQYHPDVARAGS